MGYEVHVFVAACEGSWERGTVDPAKLPFPSTRLDFTARQINRHEMPRRLCAAVDAWKPDVVFLCDGFFLKPYVSEALNHYPLALRYYAYELVCPRDSKLFLNGATCPMNYLRTPETCRPCALQGMADEIRRWRFLSWTQEYIAARAFMPGYHSFLIQSLKHSRVIVVSNPLHVRQLEGFHPDVRIIPGGVNIEDFSYSPPALKGTADKKTIFMPGRVEDPAKGMATLREAGERLARERNDFEIHVTHTDFSINNDWLKAIGWHKHDAVMELYKRSDICVVPSIWQEPFGLVAVEAMASGRPVCATRVGGLQDIVVHGETGFLFDAGNSAVLAEYLAKLLDDAGLRAQMGEAGRKRATEEYDWKRIAERCYPPIIEELARGKSPRSRQPIQNPKSKIQNDGDAQ
jgi:glycosyltransferase involved in cell wall biosynthesis